MSALLYIGLNTLRINVLESILPGFESCSVTLCVISGELFSISVPQLSYLENRDNTFFTGLS